ncbi:hypothetical protein [Legionella sp. W05-934-2]|jgi:hypothetical protein|uniref:hypothetical protein n=1 Tax=Legionella sp. W05-934-2 TaxID=1198649 RepID=UPI0034631F83
MIFNILLAIHIVFGLIAIVASLIALSSKKGASLHRRVGKLFMIAMLGIFITALPMSLMTNNWFLLCVALFSFYISLSGWRYAIRRYLPAQLWEKVISIIMILVSITMLSASIVSWQQGGYKPIVFAVFGLICLRFSISDMLLYRKMKYPKFERLVRHVGGMIGGTIAVFTAVLVTNFTYQPAWVLWIAPTVILLPLIIYWTIRIRAGKLT